MASENLVNLSLDGGEEEGFAFEFEDNEEEVADLRWCLAGRILARPGLFLFRFNHQLDMEEVLKKGPWTFDNQLLILERMLIGVQIENIPLYHADFWVQVHDLPTGLMKEKVGSTLGNYIGSLVEYDKNNNSSFWRQYMRLRVKLDVRLPLKKDTRVKDRNGNWCPVKFKYERLGIFCFVCGIMGHSENRCETRFSMEKDDGTRGWSNDLRAEPRRGTGRPTSRWLVDERGGGAVSRGGGGGPTPSGGGDISVARQTSGQSSMQGPTNLIVQQNNFENTIIPNQNRPITHINPIIPNQCHVSQKVKPPTTQLLHNDSPSNPFSTVTSAVNRVPAITSSTSAFSQPSNILFSVSASHHQHVTSAKSQVKPVIGPVDMDTPPAQSVANHYQSLNQPMLVNQPIKIPIIIPDPTSLNNSTLTNHMLPPQPIGPEKINQANPTKHVMQLTHEGKNLSALVPFHVPVDEESDETAEMDIQVLAARPAGSNDHSKLELPGTGHPECNSQPSPSCSETSSGCVVLGRSGGLAILWNDKSRCKIINYCRNFINMEVDDMEKGVWRLTCYYGFPERGRRRHAWDMLRNLRNMSPLPWCIIGDFNDLLSQEDKLGNNPHPNWLFSGFRSAVNDCDLTDIQLEGHKFTWIKSRETAHVIEERLDRAMVSSDWLAFFSKVKLINLLASHSDHSPILLQTEPVHHSKHSYSFKFENLWLKEEEVGEVVETGWCKDSCIEVIERVEACADELQRWGRRKRMRFKEEVEVCCEEMENLRGRSDQSSVQRYQELQNTHARLLVQEEAYWRQRAKMHWLKEGDLSTKFFHMSASVRSKVKKVVRLLNEENVVVTKQEDLCGVARNYFDALFKATNGNHDPHYKKT
ncbi:hypothetical protein TSUD_84560 [Trifolium subterraneum]|uniref:CCHC-type domain-containing protein n=1 Tax=Trifolium subterraneum TaxID=3900 RepID=A0A2Z6PHX7_TRISU|nr:hypothetical protein TSUD_84560 [Trifolium subterraneum]